MDAELINIFNTSTSVAGKYFLYFFLGTRALLNPLFSIVSKGISSILMKPGAKRRRSKIPIEEQKREALLQKQEIEAKLV